MSFEKDNGSDQMEKGLTQRPPSRIANAAPAYVSSDSEDSSLLQSTDATPLWFFFSSGLFSFASTTFLLSLYNVNARGVHTPNVIVGMAIFTGGLLQFIAGMWEFPRGNVFGATGKLKDIKLCIFLSLFSCFLKKDLRTGFLNSLKYHQSKFKNFFKIKKKSCCFWLS